MIDELELCITTKQFQNEVLHFFVLLMIYVVKHQNKAFSGQSSEFLCNSEDYGVMHQN